MQSPRCVKTVRTVPERARRIAIQVDRSGAYLVRQAAKSIVAAGLAKRVLVQVITQYRAYCSVTVPLLSDTLT